MGKNKTFLGMLAISAIYGLVFSLALNVFFDKIIDAIWTPVVISLVFLLFSIPLSVVVFAISKKKKTHSDVPGFLRNMIILILSLGLLSGVFEVLYEINANISYGEADSYIFLIDDSGSMTSSDPQNLRISSAEKLLSNKNNDFPYAVYVFSDEVKLAKAMDASQNSFNDIVLSSNGGTAIFGALNQVIMDIDSKVLNIHSSTRVILLSDGEATDIGTFDTKLKPLLREYGNKELIVSTIGLGNGVNSSLMGKIAKYTGGVYIHISDISELDNAMVDAAVNHSNRNLLGFRGFCKTNTLHAIMRIVFILVIAIVINIMKLYSYGKYYNKQIILTCITSIMSAVLLEVLLENTDINEHIVRTIFFVLIALTIIETQVLSRVRTNQDLLLKNDDGGAQNGGFGDGSLINGDNNIGDGFNETKHLT